VNRFCATNKANQPDTALLLWISVVVLGVNVHQQSKTVPVTCGAVKARQARKNVEVWVRVNCFSSNPTHSTSFHHGS